MSLRAAINAKCKDCIYDPLSGLGHWRQQFEACTIQSCSLWPYRPKSKARPADVANSATSQVDHGQEAAS